MVVDFVSEGTYSQSEERDLGNQWPRAPISMVVSSAWHPLESRPLIASWYNSLPCFIVLNYAGSRESYTGQLVQSWQSPCQSR